MGGFLVKRNEIIGWEEGLASFLPEQEKSEIPKSPIRWGHLNINFERHKSLYIIEKDSTFLTFVI